MTTNKDHAEAAFAEFFDVEFAGQFRRAVFLLRDRGAAEDVVHDAFVEVWRRWSEIAEPGPYLNRCVLNGCRDHTASRHTTARHASNSTTPQPTSSLTSSPDCRSISVAPSCCGSTSG